MDNNFLALLTDFVMSEDDIIDMDEYPVLHHLMNRMAVNEGYRDWVDAWHTLHFNKG
jgi:hypothetical protein